MRRKLSAIEIFTDGGIETMWLTYHCDRMRSDISTATDQFSLFSYHYLFLECLSP